MDRLWNGGGEEAPKTAAFISDKYFIFDEISFPPNSLKRSEISGMAKIAIEGMMPFESGGLLSGFFKNKDKNSATIFVASKGRLFSEIPQLKTCAYWLPERFLHARICGEITHDGANCIVGQVDSDGFFAVQDRKFKLFSDEFWTAEMHDESEKKISKSVNLINGFYKKIFYPILFLTSICTLSFASLLLTGSVVKSRKAALEKSEKKVEKIIQRNKLCNEVMSFTNNFSASLDYLSVINGARPANLIFDEFIVNSPKSARLSGSCDFLATLNAFVGNLKNIKRISSVEATNILSTNGRTTFNIKVEFL